MVVPGVADGSSATSIRDTHGFSFFFFSFRQTELLVAFALSWAFWEVAELVP